MRKQNGPSLARGHRVASPSLDATEYRGPFSVIRDWVGFPTDMVNIGLVDNPPATFLTSFGLLENPVRDGTIRAETQMGMTEPAEGTAGT